MADVGVLGLLKTFLHTQNYLGNIQFVLFNLLWSILIGPVDAYFKEDLKCAVDKGKNDNINTLCFKQYSEQYYWPISKQTLAAVNWILVLCAWVVYIVYAIFKNNNEHENEGPPIYARPKVRKFYVGQIIVRALVLLIFIAGTVVIVKMNPRDSGFSFPAHFNCTLEDNTTGGLTTTYVMCPDKYNNEKTVASIAILVLDTLVLILTVYELIVELLRAPSSNNNLEETGLELLNPNSQEDVPESDTCINSLENIPEPSYQELLKEQILSSTQRQKKLFATVHDKSDLLFDDIFTELIVYRGRMSHKLKQHNLYEREGNLWKYAEPDDIKAKLDNVEDLVKPLEEGEVAPRNIFMIGRAGIGKTMFCENIIRGWANNKLYKRRYDYVFLLNFRQLNRIKHDISLRHLLNSSPHSVQLDEATFARITMSSEKLLLIFDGFDESLDQDNFKEVAESLPDREEDDAMAVQALYYKLCTGKLLPRATIVTTSRASKASEVINEDREIVNKRTVEILGFDEEKIKEYVRKFCGEDAQKSRAFIEYITSRADLLALCYVPMNCFLVCYYLQTLKAEDISKGELPTTLTELYQRIVRLFIKEHYKSGGEPTAKTEQKPLSDATIEQLSKVAYEGVLKRQLIFDEELKNFPIAELTSCGILHEMPGIVTPEMELSPQYIFLHLTIQELLAARHVVQEFNTDQFESFVSTATTDPKWEVVLQFIAGLLSPSAKCPPKHASPTELRDVMFKCLDEGKLLLLTKCLFEYHDAAFVKEHVADIGPVLNLRKCGVSDADCTAISFFWHHAACGSVRSIELGANNIGPVGCTELKPLLTSHSEVTKLELGANKIGLEGAEHVKAALQDSNCKLTSLNLSGNRMGAGGAEHIKAALQDSNCKLTSLILSANNIGEKGAEHIKAALQDSNCKLTSLNLSGNRMGAEGAEHIKAALQDSNCTLASLNLSANDIGDEGAEHASEALRHSNCKLASLDLSNSGIGVKGAKHIRDALQHRNSTLNTLVLTFNNIGVEGAEFIREALQDSNCKLTSLDLISNGTGDKGAEHMGVALQDSSCKLTSLDLSDNEIGDKGVEHIKAALQDSNCKLTNLGLTHNNIGDEGAQHIKDAIQHSNCKLTSLELSLNDIGVVPAEHIREALKNKHGDSNFFFEC